MYFVFPSLFWRQVSRKNILCIYNILCILWETLNGCTQQSSTCFLQKPKSTRCSQWQSVKKFQINVAELISCPCRDHFTSSCLLIKFYGLISLCKVVVAFKTLNEKDKLNTLHTHMLGTIDNVTFTLHKLSLKKMKISRSAFEWQTSLSYK